MNSNNKLYKIILITLAGGFIYAINCGLRNNYGIMLNSVVENSGTTIASVSFVFAVAQLVFGMVQPFFGIISTKKGNFFTLTIGAILCTIGIILIPFSKSVITLVFCMGVLIPAGTGALSYGVIIGSVSQKIPKKNISTVSGIINAFSGFGNSIMSPILNTLIIGGSLTYAMFVFSIPTLAIILIAYMICLGTFQNKKNINNLDKNVNVDTIIEKTDNSLHQNNSLKTNSKSIFKIAFKNKTYIMLMIGFFTCGFHMAIITNHLPTEFMSYGFSSSDSSYVFSIYGIATIIGSVLSGNLCDRYRMKNVLSFFYGIRPIIVILFFILPKTLFVITFITALLGFSGASTVPPVSGLVGKTFGAKHIATLFGFVFFIHQIGGFISAWMGGVLFEITGNYTLIWSIDIILCIIATIASFIIKEKLYNE